MEIGVVVEGQYDDGPAIPVAMPGGLIGEPSGIPIRGEVGVSVRRLHSSSHPVVLRSVSLTGSNWMNALVFHAVDEKKLS